MPQGAGMNEKERRISEMNSFEYARFKLDYILERMMKDQLGDEEPNWWPDTWDVVFNLNLPGIGRRLDREKNESD